MTLNTTYGVQSNPPIRLLHVSYPWNCLSCYQEVRHQQQLRKSFKSSPSHCSLPVHIFKHLIYFPKTIPTFPNQHEGSLPCPACCCRRPGRELPGDLEFREPVDNILNLVGRFDLIQSFLQFTKIWLSGLQEWH